MVWWRWLNLARVWGDVWQYWVQRVGGVQRGEPVRVWLSMAWRRHY